MGKPGAPDDVHLALCSPLQHFLEALSRVHAPRGVVWVANQQPYKSHIDNDTYTFLVHQLVYTNINPVSALKAQSLTVGTRISFVPDAKPHFLSTSGQKGPSSGPGVPSESTKTGLLLCEWLIQIRGTWFQSLSLPQRYF
jgi:hypothetical protein